MAFFRQLKLLLWKNGLAVIRQPLWSLTLVIWPLIIFIIIAVTRSHFPPVIRDTCYVGARNLPSSGFFPFLQTLMCNTDASCHNKSHLAGSAASKSAKRYSREASPDHSPKVSPMASLMEGAGFFNIPGDPSYDPEKLIKAMDSFLGSSYQGMPHNASLMNGMNTTLLGDEDNVNEMLDSMNLLKRAICTLMLPTMNTTSPDALSYAVVTFCRSNSSLFEISLNTLNQILMDLILTKPNETLTVAGAAVLVFDHLQNETMLWETLLNVPQLLSSGSFDEVLDSTGTLLTNIQRAMHVLQGSFPEASASLSPVHPLLAGGINLVHYAQNWPGKDVSINLKEVVTLENDTLSEMIRFVLEQVTIPLDKAIFLTLDKEMVHMYMCGNSSNPMWLKGACSTGAVDMLLGWISPDKVAKQVLWVWSEHVAPHDISFAKGLLHSLMGGPSPGGLGGSNITRTHRSMVTQPENPEEELFLGVGQLVMETIAFAPELDMVFQIILKTGFQSMRSVAQALDIAEELVGSVLECAHRLKMTYVMLLTNQTEAGIWIGRVRDSVMGVITEMQSPEPSICEVVLGPFEWLLTSENIPVEIWKALICQDTSPLEQALQAGRLPLFQKAQDVYNIITEQTDDNVTLPMILSEWHKLQNFSIQFGMLFDTLVTGLGEAYWMDWMPDNNNHVTETLQQSVFLLMVNVGEQIEESQLWPEVKNSVHALYWILNYSPGVTTQPANCSVNFHSLVLECNTGLNWHQFTQRMTQVLMSPNQDVLVQFLKGAVNLLQHAYDDVFQQMIGSFLKQEITGGDALSAYLINLMRNLASFVNSITMLPNENITDPNVMIPHISDLLQSVGLEPLLPLLVSEGPVNVSTVLDVASKIGRLNQHIFTFNETDPTMPELERLIRFFLSLEGNLTISLSHIMGHTLLTYSDYFHPNDAANLIQALRPFTNQTSAGVVEAILSVMELLKTVMDSPNGDPTNIILGYIRQLQEFVMSLYRLQKIQHFPLPNRQLSPAQVSDLHLLSKDFLGLLTPESLQNLSQAGPDAALYIVAQKIVAFLPSEVQPDAAHFLQNFVTLQSHVTRCAADQDCLAGISELFTFLDQILDIMLAADSNVTVTVAKTNSVLEGREREEIVSQFFPLLLSSNDAANVETFKQILHFARSIMATQNITVSDVQNALQQSNLTLEELNNITALAGAANINDLVVNIMEIINARECFEPQHNQMVTAQCIMGLIDDVSNFLSNIPALRDQAAIVSLIPLIVNNTIRDAVQADFSSNPNTALAHTLNSTLANIKINLQLSNMYTPEIMNEIRVVEGLIQLLVNMEPLNKLNATSDMDFMQAQKVYVEMVQWYLEKLENITSTSSISELLQPFYYLTHMQVTLQLTQLDFTLFVSKQVETLINSLQHPIDSAGVSAIGQTTVEILRRLFTLLQINLEAQNEHNLLFNTTTLHAIELQVELYLNLIDSWMKQPNVSPVLSSMLQWGNPDLNASTPVTDFQHLLQTMVHFFTEDQQAYLSIIHNVTMLLSNALMVAEQPGGLQSDNFLAVILEAVQTAMQSLTTATGPLPPPVQQNILEIVQDSLTLIVQPDMSFATSRNISLLILKRAESVIQQTLAEMGAEYLLPGIGVAITYFESISTSSGPDRWNQLILNEMETLQSILPPNNPAQAYISVLINITRFILESGQGNMSLWDSFESASEDNLLLIFSQMGRLLNMLWPLITGGLGPDIMTPSLEGFAHLPAVLEHILTGTADQMTWDELERILVALLSTFSGTEIWDSVPPVIQVFEQVIESTVNNIQAQNVLILSLQTPVATLMIELAQSVNSSHLNLTEVSERMLLAIEHTLQAVEQANGTLECSEVLRAWEPVGEAAGLNLATLAMWCNMNLQPLFEAYAEANAVYAHMNISHMGVGPMTVSATAARIVRSIQSLYQVNINSTLVTVQLIEAFISQFSVLTGQPLSHAAQLHWLMQLQIMQLPNRILNEMETLQSILPPNNPAQAYISVLINITRFIWESGQGNMSLWDSFESASEDYLPLIFSQMGRLLNMLWPLITGGLGPDIMTPSLEGFAHLPAVLEHILTGTADQMTWDELERILEALLSTFSGTGIWDSVPPVIQVFEQVIGSMVNSIQAQNVLILRLQTPVATLMRELAQSVNSSHFNLTEVSERMQLAIERTLQAVEQANGTLECSEVLGAWEPVREAAGLNPATLAMWCNMNLQPLFEAYAEAIAVYAHMNMSHMGVGPMTVSATAARIVRSIQSLYQVNINSTLVTAQLIEAFISQLSVLTGQPLSHAAQLHWFMQLQNMQLPNRILNEMETLQSILPPNNPAQAYISVLINITRFIWESGQGNMSLWDSFESASEDNLPLIFSQMGRLLNMLWPLITGGPGPDIMTPSLEGFAHLPAVLEHILTGTADQMTWDELERILEALLSTFSGTEIWDSVPPVIQVFEQVIESTVNNIQAQNVLIIRLQTPVATLMIELAQSVNSSHFNLTEVLERMPLAIEHTLQAVEQANGTLECSEVLGAWEPVREAAGLNPATLAMWCNMNLQPVFEAYVEAIAVYAHMNMSHMGVGPMTVSATAARIFRSIHSLYQVNINSTLVTGQLIEAFISQLSVLTGQPLSHAAQLHWFMQLQNMQLQNSLSSLKLLSDELVKVAPFLQPCMEALLKTVHYILDNYHRIEEGGSSQELFGEAVMIFLSSANISLDDIILGQSAEFNEASVINIMREAVKLLMDTELLGDAPMTYQAMEQFLASNDSRVMIQKVAEMFEFFASTEALGLDLLIQALPKICDILRPLWAVLTQMGIEMPPIMEQFEDIFAVLQQFILTSGPLTPMDHYPGMFQQEMTSANHTMRVRNRRETSLMPARMPMDDFMDLFQLDYPAMFRAISTPVMPEEITETFHMFFANPDLNVVVKGATGNMPWGMAASREGIIDAALGMLSFFTLPAAFQMSSMDPLMNAADMLPDDFPFSSLLKNITRVLAGESQENLMLIEEAIQTATELLQISPTDPRFTEQLGHLESKVCDLEETETVRLLMSALSIPPGHLCHTLLPSLKALVESLIYDTTYLTDVIFQAVIGDPKSYNVRTDWSSALSQGLGFNTSSLGSLNINITSPGVVMVGEMLRDKDAFLMEVQQRMNFDPAILHLLMATTLPNNNLEILSWFVNLRHCNSTAALEMKATDVTILKTFCSMSVEQWYTFAVLMARHLNVEKLIYRMVLSEEIQSLVGVMIRVAEVIVDMMDMILPAVGQLRNYMDSIQDLNLPAEHEFDQMVKGHHDSISPRATFVTLSRALCSKGIVALLGISKLPTMPDSNSSVLDQHQREEMIERFKIPKNASPFCMNMYLDMVNTTGGAIAWAFLKPMLMGQILYTPDTPVTRAIMEKANATLQVFANLRKYSKEWIDSSDYIMNSAEILSNTLPMLQNSLGNSFVQNFIEMQTDINVGRMKETLSNFSNMTIMLEKNKHIMDQITTLSTLMVNLSSCIKFDRYRGYDTADQMNAEAQDLAKNRDLYASVIFKLPKDEGTSRMRHPRSSSSTSSLPPKVSYTIRMHMDNVMRTDRVRNPYYVKENHIRSKQGLRYNRGFVYLQENIDRAIIETQTGQKVTDPAVQLQPFPYPCFYRDEYLEAISFVFPLMLMIAWVLFVADFVKKLVHERELRLHEYMKMMGVNPLSHFFAWFLECASYLLMTIFILTLVLKYGNILPNSDGFLLFLYLCDYGLSILSFSYLVSSFFDKTYIAALSGSLLYILCFFPFIVVMAMETNLTFSEKSALSLFSPTCFSYASQYISRYESQGEGIHWSNSYTSPMFGDTASFGWLCWLMLIDSILYFIIGAYIRMVFPGKYGIPAPWYFPFKASFWADLCCCVKSKSNVGRGLLFSNIMQKNQPVFSDDKEKGQSTLSSQTGEDFSELPVGVALHGLSKIYGDRVAIENLNAAFYEGHVTSLLGHNGAGKTTTMSLLTGLFAPSSGSIEVYGRDMQSNIEDIRRELGVCMQYDVLFDHMTAKEHLLLYGQIKAPHWSRKELREQVRTILEETGMYVHRHKRVGTLSGGMRRKLSISIAFIGGSRLVVLDEPTTGVDPCSRRHIWDIVIQHKKNRTVIMSTHHLDEAEVLSDRIAFLERGGLKCCGSPFHLKDKLGQGYKLTLTKKVQNLDSEPIDNAEMKAFIQAHVPEARLKEAQGSDLVYSLPPFTSSNASSYRSLLTALDSNLDALQLGGYGISDTTLEEVFLQLTHDSTVVGGKDGPLSISETISDTDSIDSFPSDSDGSIYNFGDKIKLTGSSVVRGMALAWQQMAAILIKRFHHSRRDWKGLISQILLPVLFMVFAMGLSSIKNDLRHYPELELSPALYNLGPSHSFFSNKNPNSAHLVDTMMSYPGIDNACLAKPSNPVCTRSTNNWISRGNSSKPFNICKCTHQEQICDANNYQPPHKKISSSQIMYNLSGIDVETYIVATANDFIRNRYGGFSLGMPLPPDLLMDVTAVPKNRTLSKVWFNPEGHHTMPAYLNSLNNIILRANLPADKDPHKYAISVSSHPYFGRADDEDSIVQGMLQILVAMCVLTGYSITTASFAIYEVSEHHSGSKRLQHISGISEPFYWAVNFFYDMVMYLIPVTLTVAVIAAFQIPAFTDRQNLGAVTLLLVLFGFSTFPWMYLLSGVFKDTEMAFIAYVCINLFITTNTILSTSILYFMNQISIHRTEFIHELFERLNHAFLIFPQFNFGNGLVKLARMNIDVQLLSGYGIDAYKNPFSMEALGLMLLCSFIQGVVFFTLRLLLNRFLIRKVRNLIWGSKKVLNVACEDEDEDVAAEHQRVSSGAASTDLLQVNQLTKVYQHLKRKIHAVKKLSVGIPAGECFGLLGVNGAGKTTTFKMLTGDVSPTDGTAQIRDWDGRLVDIMECRNKGINIGYCPQVDALDNLLTGEEHLYFYARIRGISKREIDRVVNYLLRRLELSYHRNIITDGYSCGTRRKLSTALALIGHPQILLLDEPSSGMDPRTKRHLWKIISEEVKGKCAVVLTSHSMEECEALCGRLAIMVKGQLRCLGSLQHIKNRFGSGFTVKMYLAKASCDAEAITGFMQRRFPSTYLKDQHSSMVEYHIPIAPGGVADIFNQLESNKNALQIKHFSVSQTTLDEVFINFAMGKIAMESIALNSEDEECDVPDSIKAVET